MRLRSDVEHLAITSAEIGVFELDVTTGRIAWSEVAQQLLGLPDSAEADLETLMRRVHPREREALRQGLLQAVFECRALEAQFHVIQLDGQVRPLEVRVTPVADATGRARRMVGVCQPLYQQQAA